MDLIYTNSRRVDQGVLSAYQLDLSYGTDENENDFELVLGKSEPMLEDNSVIYIDGTEYGGIIGGMKSDSALETRTHIGRTWHGVLNSKVIQPDPGADYFVVTGEAHEVLAAIIARLDLTALFTASPEVSDVVIESYQFYRYCKGYDGIRDMLAEFGAKLKMRWSGSRVELYAEPVVDYTDRPVDGDEASLAVERHGDKVNHLICLGQGDLAEREVIHLYINRFGNFSTTQYYTGLAEIVDVFDYSSAQSSSDLRKEGKKQLRELRNNDRVNVTVYEGSDLVYDIGDIIGGSDTATGNTAKATVIQKIVKINNGAVGIEYQTGG